ncbi:hypothetical protein [Comamonas sp.]|uniref:hypothetical protein n=1 Tax=Comamonas sp. TaxID=34028 RepID=UPI003D10746B
MTDCYIVSTKYTKRNSRYITFWRPDNAGYAWPLCWAGRYDSESVKAEQDYYNNGDDTVAVLCSAVDALGIAPHPGDVDGDKGPVVINSKGNWNAILAGLVAVPLKTPRPNHRRAQ